MAVVFKEVEAQALALPESERSALVTRLLDSLDVALDDSPAAVAAAWDAEVTRRVAEFESDKTQAIPHEQVMTKLHGLIDRHRAS